MENYKKIKGNDDNNIVLADLAKLGKDKKNTKNDMDIEKVGPINAIFQGRLKVNHNQSILDMNK